MPLAHWLFFAGLLFAVGLSMVVGRRHWLGIWIGFQWMIGGVVLSLAAFDASAAAEAPTLVGQRFGVLILAASAAQLAVALGAFTAGLRNRESLDSDDAGLLKW